ncbi:hypothetical protein CKA32_003611 [Geitlerinema sp. FC II]|nr:hypothetical protein CKA32_003611 [Geitlerinema sp. FC II]
MFKVYRTTVAIAFRHLYPESRKFTHSRPVTSRDPVREMPSITRSLWQNLFPRYSRCSDRCQ